MNKCIFQNGSKFWVEYENFVIEKSSFDDIKYQLSPAQEEQRNSTENYPITSMKQINSSHSFHQFVIIRPNYLNSVEQKCDDRQRGLTKITHDRFYAGFFAQV